MSGRSAQARSSVREMPRRQTPVPGRGSWHRVEAQDAAERLGRALAAGGYAGYDPYDALASPILRSLARTRLSRRAAIQALKHSLVNVRPVLGIPRLQHTKALALLVSAHSRLAKLPNGDVHHETALNLAKMLAERALERPAGVGFGYDFDVQTRWGYYRRGEPNAVVTAFAANAMLDAAELGEKRFAAFAVSALDFAVDELLRERDEGRFFAYVARSSTPIHNASVLIASLAARVEASPEIERAAADAIAFTVAHQRPDGSWPYGEGKGLGWVDGYHTAYVIDGLATWRHRFRSPAVDAAIERGLDLYLVRLFDPDGAPRASLEARYPIDIHAAATAITTLSRLAAQEPRALATADAVLMWTLTYLRRRDGRFAFQCRRRFRNSVCYVRWADAHMLLALADYLTALEDDDGG